MKAGYIAIKHGDGYELTFRDNTGTCEPDNGTRFPTRASALAQGRQFSDDDAQGQADQRRYESGYAYACGYQD